MSHDQRHSLTGNTHEANPSAVMTMAKAMGTLPAQVLLIGCQPLDATGLGLEMTPEVTAAVEVAIAEVEAQLATLCAGQA